jgi:hypothetical protein
MITIEITGESPWIFTEFYKEVDEEKVLIEKLGPWDNLEWATEWSNNHLAELQANEE